MAAAGDRRSGPGRPVPYILRCVASACVAVGAAGIAYWQIGDLSTDRGRETSGLVYTWGPYRLPLHWLAPGAALAVAVGVAGLSQLAWWTGRGRIGTAWWLATLGITAAACVTAWGWRVLTGARYPGAADRSTLAEGAVVAAWFLAFAAVLVYGRADRRPSEALRGCAYCRLDGHLTTGDVQQLSINDSQTVVLVGCPRCGWLYQFPLAHPEWAVHLHEADARELFPSTW